MLNKSSNEPKMRLYEFSWGIYPRRVLIYIAEKNIEVERISIDIVAGENRKPEFLKVNPAGTVPVLQLEDGTIIRESIAIVEYLEEVYPHTNLLGTTAFERAQTRQAVQMINETYNAFNLYCGHTSTAFRNRLDQSSEVAEVMYQQFRKGLRQINDLFTNGPFLFGQDVTYADCALFASAQFAKELYKSPIPDECPKIRVFYEEFAKRPSSIKPEYPTAIAAIAPLPERED